MRFIDKFLARREQSSANILRVCESALSQAAAEYNAKPSSAHLPCQFFPLKNASAVREQNPLHVASTAHWALVVCATRTGACIYQIPSADLADLQTALTASRIKLSLNTDGREIKANNTPVSFNEVATLVHAAFVSMIKLSRNERRHFQDPTSGSASSSSLSLSLNSRVQHILAEKYELAQKFIDQQERLQRHLAAELHDGVIGDLMMLQRELDSAAVAPAQVKAAMDEVVLQIRDICLFLTPGNLTEWGLEVVVQALLDGVQKRSGADCEFIAAGDLPELPDEVSLHVYRIIQEAVMNADKHSGGTSIVVRLTCDGNCFTACVTDNGKGVNGERKGGLGAFTLRERAEILNAVFPTELQVNHISPGGTEVKLTLQLQQPASAGES